MANFITNNVTYAGKEAQEIFVKNIYNSDLKSYGIRYIPGVKGKTQLATGDVKDLFTKYACSFAPNGGVTLNETFIEPVALKVNLEQCYDAFWNSFLSYSTEVSLRGEIPAPFFEWFFNDVLIKELNKEYEDLFFNGDTAYTGSTALYLKETDGVVKKLRNGGAKTITGEALTVANILDKIGEVSAKVDELDNDVEGYKIFLNFKDYRKMLTALGANSPLTTNVWANFVKDGAKVYAYGLEVVPCRVAENTIIASHPMNLVLGYDAEDSRIEYRIIDMRETNGDNSFRVLVITNIAPGVVYPESSVVTTAIG